MKKQIKKNFACIRIFIFFTKKSERQRNFKSKKPYINIFYQFFVYCGKKGDTYK